MSKNIVLGAGVCGMSAGIKLGCTIYEATSQAGGICTDYIKDGFRFSNGGPHFLFGKDKGLEYIKSLVEVKEYERRAGVYYNHTFPYPFQSNIPGDWQVHQPCRTDNFKNWLMDNFGPEQCALFFNPFNEKYTAGLMDKILPQDSYKTPKNGNGWVSTFCDPVGGLSSLVDKMANQCDIRFNKKAKSIDVDKKLVYFGLEDVVSYDKLISTIPLNNLINRSYDSNGSLEKKLNINLPYTSVLVINIGAEASVNTPTEHWLYIPFCKSGFHRVAFYTNVDSSKAPEGKVGLSIEIAFKDTNYEDLDIEKITFDVISELQSWNWIGEVITTHADFVKCAYTWQYNREEVPKALQWLKERDIISTGRYGKWKFQGLTQSIEDGFNVET